MRVRGRVTDTKPHGLGLADGTPLVIHDMIVDLLIQTPQFEIIEVETQMETRPFGICSDILDDYQQLVGVSIARGYSRKVKELFGGPGGCAHIGALLLAMGPVAIQASWSQVTLHDDLADRLEIASDPKERERRLRMNTNTCHVWAEDGPQLTAVELGRSPLRPEWEIERLHSLGIDVGDQPG